MKQILFILLIIPVCSFAQQKGDNTMIILSKDSGIYNKFLLQLVKKGFIIADKKEEFYIQTAFAPVPDSRFPKIVCTLNCIFKTNDSGNFIMIQGYFHDESETVFPIIVTNRYDLMDLFSKYFGQFGQLIFKYEE